MRLSTGNENEFYLDDCRRCDIYLVRSGVYCVKVLRSSEHRKDIHGGLFLFGGNHGACVHNHRAVHHV